MTETPHPSPLRTELAGLARAMDLVIVLPQRGDYENLLAGKQSAMVTYAHEWTHYFQFISTNLGHTLIELHHVLFEIRFRFLEKLRLDGWDTSTPALEWVKSRRAAISDESDLLLHCILDIENIFADEFSYFHSKGYTPTHDSREIRLMDGDPHTGQTVQLGTWKGRLCVLPILEHAAIANEYVVSRGFSFDRFFDPSLADYFFAFWYLMQKGSIRLRPEAGKSLVTISSCSFDTRGHSVPLILFLFSQMALNIGEMVSVGKAVAPSWREQADPGGFLVRARAMSTVASFVFGQLLERFDEAAKTVVKTIDRGGTWVEAGDDVCELLRFPSYGDSVRVGIQRMSSYLEEFSRKQFESELLQFLYVKTKEVMLAGLQNLLAHPRANAMPLLDFGTIPFPKVMCFSTSNERRLIGIRFPWSDQEPVFIDVPKHVLSYCLEQERILEGRCYDSEVTCYPPVESNDLAHALAVWQCTQFRQCRKLNKCVNEEWVMRRRYVTIEQEGQGTETE